MDLDGKTDIVLQLFGGESFCVYRNLGNPALTTVSVSLPDTVAVLDSKIEIPVYISDVTDKGILSYQFGLEYDSPNAILVARDTLGVAGTLSASEGWSVLANTSTPNKITVAGFGPIALVGKGVLLRLKFVIDSNATVEQYSTLHLTDFTLNSGTPAVSTKDGKITIRKMMCGDADENGVVQAYDAALTLREAIGPMPAPPAPLSAQGRLNADVDMNGHVQAYDAALILRHVLGLSTPAGVGTCFSNSLGRGSALESSAPHIGISFASQSEQGNQVSVRYKFRNDNPEVGVLALSFTVVADPVQGTGEPYVVGIADGTYMVSNTIGRGQTNVGIVCPTGMNVDDLRLVVPMSNNGSSSSFSVTNLVVNNLSLPEIVLPLNPAGMVGNEFRLIGNYPNPFNPSSRIVFSLPEQSPVKVEIFNAMGSRVKVLLDDVTASGQHEISWDGTNEQGRQVASGTYICQLRSPKQTRTLRMILLR